MLQKSETKLPKITRYCGGTRVMLMYCITVQSFLLICWLILKIFVLQAHRPVCLEGRPEISLDGGFCLLDAEALVVLMCEHSTDV